MHLDIEADDVDAEANRLEALGAKKIAFVKRWWVMDCLLYTSTPSADAGTVVGAMQVGDAVVAQAAIAAGGVKAMPAVRATARKLGVDIARVVTSGADGTVTMEDVKRAAADGSAKPGAASVGRPSGPNRQAIAAEAAPTRSASPMQLSLIHI